MPAHPQRKSERYLQLTNSDQATAHGGQVLMDALYRRFGLWQRAHDEPSMDPAYALRQVPPHSHMAQFLLTLTSGVSRADAEHLGQRASRDEWVYGRGYCPTQGGKPTGCDGCQVIGVARLSTWNDARNSPLRQVLV